VLILLAWITLNPIDQISEELLPPFSEFNPVPIQHEFDRASWRFKGPRSPKQELTEENAECSTRRDIAFIVTNPNHIHFRRICLPGNLCCGFGDGRSAHLAESFD
jgi:hypothetical protein